MDETQTNNRSAYDKGIGDDLRQIGVVTKYELLKHIRSKRMIVFVGIAALLFTLTTVLSIFLDGGLPDQKKDFMETYLSMVNLLIIIGVSLFCASTIAAEFEERTALLMFPRPIKKTSFFLGKVLACYVLCGVIIVAYYLACMLLSLVAADGLDMNVFGSLGIALMFMFGAGGFALLMSSIFKRGAMAVIVTIAVLMLVFNIIDSMLSMFGTEPVYSITYAAKDISNFIANDPTHIKYDLGEMLHTTEIDFVFEVFNPTHLKAFSIAAIWGVVTTTISALIFRRKEF